MEPARAPTLDKTLRIGRAVAKAYHGMVGKGYAEGSAAEERYEALERAERGEVAEAPPERQAVYGSTDDEPERHFLGWLDEVDPDELFTSGRAWGITVVRRRDG